MTLKIAVILLDAGTERARPILAEGLGRFLPISKVTFQPVMLPEHIRPTLFWGQLLAPAVLAFLEERFGRGGPDTVVLALCSEDLTAPGLNFVFGQARLNGGPCVVSLARLGTGAAFRRRLLVESVHEIGHALGLHHCKVRGCVMRFSNTLDDTDEKGPGFCERCSAIVHASSSHGRDG